MVTIRKCRSLKHRLGGCGDPKCPEGLSLKAALDEALKSNDLDAYFTAREKESLRATRLLGRDGWGTLSVEDKNGKEAKVRIPLARKDLVEQVKAIDKNIIPSFNSIDEFRAYVEKVYGKAVVYSLVQDAKDDNHYPVEVLGVSQITVAPDVRGLGISNHLKKILVKYADEHNAIITGTPTNSGDGTIIEGQEGWHDNALAHRERLIRSYKKFGYEKNPCFSFSDKTDYLTGEPHEYDREQISKFTPVAQRMLSNTGIWVRWPNGVIPKVLLSQR